MRIIAGKFKGRKLLSPAGMTTRPTSDRLRESIFSILSSEAEDASVLDLFAGTGAMGLEALSRGAGSAVFIDINRKALSVIAENIRKCGQEEHTRRICRDILKNLNCLNPAEAYSPPAFSLVFIDPPYHQQMAEPALRNLVRSNALAPGAKIVLEHSRVENIPDADLKSDLGLELMDRRKYGKTWVSFFEYGEYAQNSDREIQDMNFRK